MNPVRKDKTGWDGLLEFPLFHTAMLKPHVPMDRGLDPLQCFVQVKATDGRQGKWKVKLSNWSRFVLNPFPAFFLVYEFDSQPMCQRAYLVHVGDTYIRDVLKRLRELELEQRTDLHHVSMSFTYSEADALPSLDGKGLEEVILRHVGSSPTAYMKQKQHHVETVGYEEGAEHINFSIKPVEGYANFQEYLVDILLGLVSEVKTTHFQKADTRFGITISQPKQLASEEAFVSFKPYPIGTATLRFWTPDNQNRLRIETDLYVPDPNIIKSDSPFYKIRFKTPFLDMISVPRGKAEFQLTVPHPDDAWRFHTLRQASELFLFMHNVNEQRTHFKHEVTVRGRQLVVGTGKPDTVFENGDIEYAMVIENAWQIAKGFDLDLAIDVKPSELLVQKSQLFLVNLFINPQPGTLTLQFNSEENIVLDELPFCAPLVQNLVIGPHKVLVVAILFGTLTNLGKVKKNGYHYQMTVQSSKIQRQDIYSRDEVSPYTREQLMDMATKEYEDSHQVLLLSE